jgi:predicted glycoside hydrolase/deacetylase ChbG (UPF0249 family)
MKSVTVTADDAGMHPAVDRAVEACCRAGRVDRVSILATGPSAEAACAAAMENGVQVSVHLDCIRGPFILKESRFPGTPAGWFSAGRRLADQVRREWSAQVEKLLSMGAMVTCLDSHRHLHHLPGLRSVILTMAGEYGIGTVRAAVLPDRLRRLPGSLVLDAMGKALQREAAQSGIATARWMLGFSLAGRVSRAYLERFLKTVGEDTVELVMHPAVENLWSPGQAGELELILSPWFSQALG